MGRKWTAEEKKAASERAKAKIAAANENKNPEPKNKNTTEQYAVWPSDQPEPENTAELKDPMSGPQPAQSVETPQLDVNELVRRIQELEAAQWRNLVSQQPQPETTGLRLGANGSVVGTRDKYSTDRKRYPDPTERLANEPMLRRFAFTQNYELKYRIDVTQYQTKDGINTREPRFTVELHRVVYDDDTGKPTNKRYILRTAVFHEDPEAALVIAQDNGIDVEAYEEEVFLNEMRYLRMRDWLIEAFYPPKNTGVSNKKEMVIGNRVVEVFELNTQGNETVPFSQLTSKLKA